MPKASYILLLAFQISWALTCTATSTGASHLESKLDRPVHDYQVTAENFVEALVQVANEFQVPIGIQWVNTATTRAGIALSWHDSTVRRIFDSIVATQPGYRLAITNGVLHVFSTAVPSSENFLSLKINSFESHDVVVEMAERKLRTSIRAVKAPPSSESVGVGGSLATNTGEPVVALKLNNVTAGDVLDALITVSDKKIWVVTFVEDSTTTATGLHRTISLWTDSRVPDDEQPVWNLFRWNDPIPATGLAVR